MTYKDMARKLRPYCKIRIYSKNPSNIEDVGGYFFYNINIIEIYVGNRNNLEVSASIVHEFAHYLTRHYINEFQDICFSNCVGSFFPENEIIAEEITKIVMKKLGWIGKFPMPKYPFEKSRYMKYKRKYETLIKLTASTILTIIKG